MKERKLYSLTGKLIVFLLLIVFAASALFGGIQTLMLSSVGLTPNAAAKKYAFEETTACGTLVQRQLHNVMSYYNDMSKFGTNGRYDGTKEIDYRAFATDGEGSGGISTTYTIDQLVKMYDDGSSADLNEVAAYTADNYATNDAGIDKEAYLAYEDGTDVSQETEETDVAAFTEEVSAADAETFDSFSPDGEVYFPSDNAVKSLKEKKIDPADVSSQFLYLYDQGMSLETQKTKAGTYLYEYAAANLKKVSIRDLYMTLSGVTEEVAAFKNQESGISVDADDANLWYCLEDKEGNIYTNVDSWKNGYTTAIAQKSPYPFAFAVDRTGGADKVRSYATRKNSPAVEAARSYLLNNQIADNYQKIFVALDPDLAASDYFSQYSEIYSQWLPKMQLLLLMIAVGGIGTLVCLVLFTLQAGRNGKNKEIRLYFFDQWYTEIAAAAAILIVMGAVGIVAVCIELSYGGVHYIQNFDGEKVIRMGAAQLGQHRAAGQLQRIGCAFEVEPGQVVEFGLPDVAIPKPEQAPDEIVAVIFVHQAHDAVHVKIDRAIGVVCKEQRLKPIGTGCRPDLIGCAPLFGGVALRFHQRNSFAAVSCAGMRAAMTSRISPCS